MRTREDEYHWRETVGRTVEDEDPAIAETDTQFGIARLNLLSCLLVTVSRQRRLRCGCQVRHHGV